MIKYSNWVCRWFTWVRVWHPKLRTASDAKDINFILDQFRSAIITSKFVNQWITILTKFIWTFDLSKLSRRDYFTRLLNWLRELVSVEKFLHLFQIIGNCSCGSFLEKFHKQRGIDKKSDWRGMFGYPCYIMIWKHRINWNWKMFVSIVVHKNNLYLRPNNVILIVSPVRSTYGGYYGSVVVMPRPPRLRRVRVRRHFIVLTIT